MGTLPIFFHYKISKFHSIIILKRDKLGEIMSFNSLSFIFICLPIIIIIYYLIKIIPFNSKPYIDWLLLCFSLFFYFYVAGLKYLYMMVFFSVIHYSFSTTIGICINRMNIKYQIIKKALLFIDLILSISILVFFKYVGIFEFGKDIIFPLAISFTTFSSISFVVDVYRGKIKMEDVNVVEYFLFIFLFIKLTQGPIATYDRSQRMRAKFTIGISKFCFGLSKKVLLADILAPVVQATLLNILEVGTAVSWLGIIAFTMQLYFDFSGYTDMALGIGYMLGYELPDNFNDPYLATSITDFWRKWHMTLGSWFKNYVYIPLGGNRKGKVRTSVNLIIVFILTGLWHGSTISFLLWGLYYGVFMIAERAFLGKILKKNPIKILNTLYVVFVVMMGWVLFISSDLETAANFYSNLFVYKNSSTSVTLFGLMSLKVTLALIIGACLIFIKPLIINRFAQKIGASETFLTIKAVVGIVLLLICVAFITTNSYSPSIYGGF